MPFRTSTLLLRSLGLAILLVAAPAVAAEPTPSYLHDVLPVLTRYGCNSGGCHGKQAGQNGFRLSLRGYAPELDYDSLTRESRGRRLNLAAPELSLLVRKPTGQSPHGGGVLLEPDSRAAAVLRAWIAAGAPGAAADEPTLQRLAIEPAAATLAVGESLPLRAIAQWSDGRATDVTWLTQFEANDATIVAASAEGVVTPLRPGETAVRGAFLGQIEIALITTPYDHAVDGDALAERRNYIDEHVLAKLAQLRIAPAPPCDDATFLRRVSLDLIGTLPTVDQVRAFLADDRADKRERLVDELLDRPEFVDYWAQQLGDLLQNRRERDHDVRGVKGVRLFHAWIRQQLLDRRSWNDIARDVLLAEGDTVANPAVGYYIVTVGEHEPERSEVADSVAQAFLGVRIGCARCHNHPLEKLTQDDYYHFLGFFTRVGLQRVKAEEGPTRLRISSRHEINLLRQQDNERQKLAELEAAAGDEKQREQHLERIAQLDREIAAERLKEVRIRQPRTGAMLAPQPLDRSLADIGPGDDPRRALVDWITSPDNEYFAGAMVNRLWRHFFAVGLVEPVDDLRATNPPSNPALWAALVDDFVAGGYDLRRLMRTIVTSRTYQLAAETNAANETDTRHYSHYYVKRLGSEVLLDALAAATEAPERFDGYPQGVRAIQLPDAGVDHYFLKLFGRSERTTACACERTGDVTLPQLLHLQNSDSLLGKIRHGQGRIERLLRSQAAPEAAVEELFLATLSRPPRELERAAIAPLLAEPADRREALADLLWSLLNTPEFVFNH